MHTSSGQQSANNNNNVGIENVKHLIAESCMAMLWLLDEIFFAVHSVHTHTHTHFIIPGPDTLFGFGDRNRRNAETTMIVVML